MKTPTTANRLHILALISVLIVGFTLRLAVPTLVEYKLDEANVVHMAQQIAYENYRPAVGANSSIGVLNLPFMPYLMAFPIRLWSDPLSAILFTGFLNGLALVVCYGVGRRYFGPGVGLIATLLFATGAWAVLYGRKIWPRTLPLFTLTFVGSLLLTFVDRKPWALVGAFVSLAALIGLQLEGIAFIPILGLVSLLYYRDVALKPLLTGVSLLALAMLPYLIYDARHGWASAQSFLSFTGGKGSFSLAALRYMLELTGSVGIERLVGNNALAHFRAGFPTSVPAFRGLDLLMMALGIGAALYATVRVFRHRFHSGRNLSPHRPLEILLVWLYVPILLQLRSVEVQPHYFVLLYPVCYLLVAVLLMDGLRHFSRSRFLVLGLILFLGLWSSWQTANVVRLWNTMTRYPTTGGYGIPLRYPRAAAQVALAQQGAVRLLSEGTLPTVDEQPTVFDTLLFPRPRAFADGDLALPLPDTIESAFVVGPVPTGDGSFRPQLDRLEGLEKTWAAGSVPLSTTKSYIIYYRQNKQRDDLLVDFIRLPGDVPFANGLVFTAYQSPQVAQPGECIVVELAWWLHEAFQAERLTQFYIHLLDAEGTLLAQVDHDGGYPVQSWHSGDLVLSRFTLQLPADLPTGTYRVRAGLYTYPEIEPIPVVDPVGNPVDHGVTLTEIEIRR